jgi:hypothetical protein
MGSRALRVGSLADHDPGSPFQLIDSIRIQIEERLEQLLAEAEKTSSRARRARSPRRVRAAFARSNSAAAPRSDSTAEHAGAPNKGPHGARSDEGARARRAR